MLDDGIKDLKAEKVQVKDVAEVLAEAVLMTKKIGKGEDYEHPRVSSKGNPAEIRRAGP